MKKSSTILGIDPGTVVMGYGVLTCTGEKMELISLGTIHLSKFDDHYKRLNKIFERVQTLIKQYQPDVCAIEAPFFGKNVQSMLKLGRAQGVAMAAALTNDIPIYEYSPRKIKMSITGNGNASKEQVAGMVEQLLKFKATPKYLDATDGLATAICHHFQSKNPQLNGNQSYSSWEQFVKSNSKRVK